MAWKRKDTNLSDTNYSCNYEHDLGPRQSMMAHLDISDIEQHQRVLDINTRQMSCPYCNKVFYSRRICTADVKRIHYLADDDPQEAIREHCAYILHLEKCKVYQANQKHLKRLAGHA